MTVELSLSRRQLLRKAGFVGAALLIPAPVEFALAAEKEENVSPAEDLMREHGLLNRILLIYDEHIRRIERKENLDPAPLTKAAGVIKDFVENYHEKLEEQFLFPRFEKAGRKVELVRTLRAQHEAGRKLTSSVLEWAGSDVGGNRDKIGAALGSFVRMYRPHEAREDTVLFPAFRKIVSRSEYDALGEDFEDRERQLFGDDGFERMVEQVAGIEKSLGLYELSRFTPRVR